MAPTREDNIEEVRQAQSKGILHSILAFEKALGAKVPTIPPDADLTGAQAVATMREGAFNLFPGLQTKT
jgi:hypothetical protein